MGRTPCCDQPGLKKGSWTEEEDRKLLSYVQRHGEGGWRFLPEKAGLLRCGKSCRLRWANYLRPGIKRGEITPEEEEIIIQLHAVLGNKWSTIARQLYKRTDNEIKNYWNTRLKRRVAKMCSSTSSSTTTTVDHVAADHQTTKIKYFPGTDHLANPSQNNVHNVENNKAPVISGATSATISITRDVNKGAMSSTPTPTSSYCGPSTSTSTTTSDFDQVCRRASTSARILNKIASNLTLLNLPRVVVGGGGGGGGGAGESSVDGTKGSSVDEFSPYRGCNSGSPHSSTPSNVDPLEYVSPAQHTGFSALSDCGKFMCHEGMEIDHDLEMFLSETDAYEIAKEVLEGDNVDDHQQMLVTSFPNGSFSTNKLIGFVDENNNVSITNSYDIQNT